MSICVFHGLMPERNVDSLIHFCCAVRSQLQRLQRSQITEDIVKSSYLSDKNINLKARAATFILTNYSAERRRRTQTMPVAVTELLKYSAQRVKPSGEDKFVVFANDVIETLNRKFKSID